MKLSIIIPVYNEQRFVSDLIDQVLEVDLSELGLGKELVIVDDGSSDGTSEILAARAEGEPSINLFRHQRNQGKGAAIRTGFEKMSGEVALIQDADLEYDPREYAKLLAPIMEGKAEVVFGSRFISGEPHRVLYFWHFVANRILTIFSNALTDLNLSDMEVCYKVFKADIVKRIKIEEDRFGFEPEVTAKIAKLSHRHQCRIYEVGISYSGRTYSEGKKITWRDALSAFRCIIKYNLLR